MYLIVKSDIKVKEQSIEAMMKGRKEYEPPRFMTINIAAKQLLDSLKELQCNQDDLQENNLLLTEETLCVALARVGSEKQLIRKSSLKNLLEIDMGPPLHSLIIVGRLHHIESEMLKLFD